MPIDELWLHVVLAAIGETLEADNDSEVMGVVCNIRKGFYRISLWTRTDGKAIPASGGNEARSADDCKAILKSIGRNFKDAMNLPETEAVEFTSHNDSAHSGSTRARAKDTV